MSPFKIMTFNLKGSYYEDGANNWPLRAQLNSDTINKFSPDLIGFQEVQQGNIDHYARTLMGCRVRAARRGRRIRADGVQR